MSVAAAPDHDDGNFVPPGGDRFGLAPDDMVVLEALCQKLLKDSGVDGSGFFARLGQGEAFGSALGVTPEIVELLYARACRWFSIGRPDRAQSLFHTLCVLQSDVADYWVGLGVCMRLQGKNDHAALALDRAASLRPDWAVPVFHRAELALFANDPEMATALLRRFDRLVDDGLSATMLAEAERIRTAMEMRRTPSQRPENGR